MSDMSPYETEAFVHRAFIDAGLKIEGESPIKKALESTAQFFDKGQNVGNIWLDAPVAEFTRDLQSIIGELQKNTKLKDPIRRYINNHLGSQGETILQTWSVPNVPEIALAEVELKGTTRLGWFRSPSFVAFQN